MRTIRTVEVDQRERELQRRIRENSLFAISVVNTSPRHNHELLQAIRETFDNRLGYQPSAQSPYLNKERKPTDAPVDMRGNERLGEVDLGPVEFP